MRTGIGIDTGGTYTDAVIYDFEKKEILFSNKSLTTKEDLSIGIGNVLDMLPKEQVDLAQIIALSTTLATNACVENKGGYAKLIFIGSDEHIIRKVGKKYGLPPAEDIMFVDCDCGYDGSVNSHPDWRKFIRECDRWAASVDAVSVVSIHAMKNNAVLEKKARELITDKYGLPVVCGHELFDDLNLVQRGAGTLLNAKLIPVIREFLDAVYRALEKRQIKAPVVIVRSDGSVMSESFTSVRPVETLISGPAASVLGGAELTNETDSLVIDMGGTTTDISIIKDGIPKHVEEGINIGSWRTFVKGVYIDTFGLGGDSMLTYDKNGRLDLESYRAVPISVIAARWPEVSGKLKKLKMEHKKHTLPLYEFFVLQKSIEDNERYTAKEKLLCRELKNGPLIYKEAARILGVDIYSLNTTRLEHDGVIIRSALTPTDMMHIKGDYLAFDKEAAVIAAEFAAASINTDIHSLADTVYDMVKSKLYYNIVRLLLEQESADYKTNGIGKELKKLIYESYELKKARDTSNFIDTEFKVKASLIGIGAPIHIFLPDVAKALGTRYVVPKEAGVANALGAVIGNIRAVCAIEVRPEYSVSGITGYIVFGKDHNTVTQSREEAMDKAADEAKKAAASEALKRGATGDITFNMGVSDNVALTKENAEVYLGSIVSCTAYGRVAIRKAVKEGYVNK